MSIWERIKTAKRKPNAHKDNARKASNTLSDATGTHVLTEEERLYLQMLREQADPAEAMKVLKRVKKKHAQSTE